jgi:hypothetical protein
LNLASGCTFDPWAAEQKRHDAIGKRMDDLEARL